MLSIQTITPGTLELLKSISAQPEIHDLRLVGGTALALQYGHRQSVDLDFFGTLPEDKDVLIDVARRVGEVMVLNRSKIILLLIKSKWTSLTIVATPGLITLLLEMVLF